MILIGGFSEDTALSRGGLIGEGIPRARPDERLAGLVLSTFRHGFYVRVNGCLFAIGGPAIPAGPIHITLRHAPPRPREGTAIQVLADRIVTEAGEILLGDMCRYQPDVPMVADFASIVPWLSRFGSVAYFPEDILPVRSRLTDALNRADLDLVRRVLQGRGGGLTPSGDDVLAGILLSRIWSGADPADVARIADGAATTDLSRAFLFWAARGQSIAPLHDLVRMLVVQGRRDGPDVQLAVEKVSRIGASSGKALLAGLGLGASAYMRSRGRGWREAQNKEGPCTAIPN